MNARPKRVAIITGASSGIGKETAERFLREGYEVHAAARRLDAMRTLAEQGAHLHHLDLTHSESITAFVAEVLAQSGRIDVLVNNAGYGSYGAVEDVPLSDARAQMEVNLFGLAHLIQLVLPTMRTQRSGRIINISSIGGKIWSPLGAWYHASKFAVEGFSDALRNEVRPFGIAVIVVEPGGVNTDWPAIAAANAQKTSGSGPYRPIAEQVARMFASDSSVGTASPRQIADVIWRGASARRPRARYVAPFSAQVILGLRWALSDRAFDGLWTRIFRIPRTITPSAKEA